MDFEEKDMRCQIHRLEDKMLRCKNIKEQLRMQVALNNYRKRLQEITRNRQIYGSY